MRHRIGIASNTGLGNLSSELMDNRGKVNRTMLKEATTLFFSKWGGCDYSVKENGILMGIEPAYQYDYLKVIFLARDKGKSYFEQGRAWGAWGSEIASTRKYYADYKRKSKFVRFIDKWFKNLSSQLLGGEEG